MAICKVVAAIAFVIGDPAIEDATSVKETARVRESAERVLGLARRYEFYADVEQKTKFELQSKSLLTYSNPVLGEVYGNVFVWTRGGRPEVLGAIFDFRSERRMDSEFHLLANRGTLACRDGKPFLELDQPGVEFRPVVDSQTPAATASGRLRQMRDLAREFTVERDHPVQKKEFMRLLPQPVYRFASAEFGILDGAIFVFVEGTDPEAFLLLEAVDQKQLAWRFAFARMNLVEFWGRRQDQVVWQVDPADWNAVFEKHQAYFIVREQPSRGLVRAR